MADRQTFLALRAVNGQLAGTLYPVGDEVVFGRARTCNVVLWNPTISRTHAVLQQTADGFALIDLGSRTGVSIGGQRVSEGMVDLGTPFAIGTYQFVLERIDTPLELPELVPDAVIVGDFGEDAGEPQPYEGDLLADIVRYRNLRSRLEGGEMLGSDDIRALVDLERQLAIAESSSEERRSIFQRFRTKAMVTVRLRSDRSCKLLLGVLEDVSVVGARVRFMTSPALLEIGAPIELVVGSKPNGDAARHDVFWAQAVWRNGLDAGFCFRGQGRWGRFTAKAG